VSAVEVVQLWNDRPRRPEALRVLVGRAQASHLSTVEMSTQACCALLAGMAETHPQVRWWCVQLGYHSPDPMAVPALTDAVDDPVSGVRRKAAHALGCRECKPAWEGRLEAGEIERLAQMAASDPNPTLAREADRALACHGVGLSSWGTAR
jgi:hypothetical protein